MELIDNNLKIIYKKIIKNYKNYNYDKALKYINKYIFLKNEDTEIFIIAINIYLKLGDESSAIYFLKKIKEKDKK